MKTMCIVLTMKDKIDSFVHIIHDTKAVTSLFALVLAIIMVGTTIILPLQLLNAQNMTIKMSNATSSNNTDAS